MKIRKEHGVVAAIIALLLFFARDKVKGIEKKGGDTVTANISFEAKGSGFPLIPISFELVSQGGPTLIGGSEQQRISLIQSWQNYGPYSINLRLPRMSLLAYYRAYSGGPNRTEKEDIDKATNDWAADIVAPGFDSLITTNELLILTDEYESGKAPITIRAGLYDAKISIPGLSKIYKKVYELI